MEIIKDVWAVYGVKYDPFSTSPILVKGGYIPPECFIGREEQILQLGKSIGSKGGSRTLVYGDVGVGKTSFVNVVRRLAYEKGYFTPLQEIAVQSDWSPDDFVLNTLSGIYGTIQISTTKPLGEETYRKLESLTDIGVSDTSLNLQIMGTGGGYTRDRQPLGRLTSLTLINFFSRVCQEIIDKTGREIIIHYNNLELLPEKTVKKIFENLRDFFQTDGVHFIFVGNLTIKGYFQAMPRFSSIISDTPISIETLSFEEILEIINKRFEILKIEDLDYVIPFTKDCLEVLFELWGGNIRHILNSLSTAVQEVTHEKPVVLDENLLAKTLKNVLEKRYFSHPNITPRKREVLEEIVKRNEITIKSLVGITGIERSNLSHYVRDLEEVGCVYLRRKTGKDKFWSADPIFKWSILKEKDEIQRTLI